MVLRLVMRSGRGSGGPWGGGPWGGRGRGPYGGWPGGGQGGWPGRGQGSQWPGTGQTGTGQTGTGQTGTGQTGTGQTGTGQQPSAGGPWPGSPGAPAGGDAGWEAGGGSTAAGGEGGWSSGGGPAGGGWATGGVNGDGSIPAGSSRGAGERLAGAGSAWPGEDSRDWMNDPRPAAASIPGELFPVRHARAMQAASPLDAGLAAIRAHDPAFDLEEFIQQVQRVFFVVEDAWGERKPELARQVMADDLWLSHRAQIQAYSDSHKSNRLDYLAVSNIWPVAASSDGRFDTITVRIVAASTDYDVDDTTGRVLRGDTQVKPWEEDWTFRRSSAARTKEGGPSLGSTCPNCGAPLDIDLAGSCRYCKAAVMTGDYGWVLARISQVG